MTALSMSSKVMTPPLWGTDLCYLERWWCLRARFCGWGFLRGGGYLGIGIGGYEVAETVVVGSRGGDVCSGGWYLGFGLGRRMFKKKTMSKTKKKMKMKQKRKRKRRVNVTRPHRRAYLTSPESFLTDSTQQDYHHHSLVRRVTLSLSTLHKTLFDFPFLR